MTISKRGITCRICGSQEPSEWLHPAEMMFGLREQFAYYRCAVCSCLQIDEVPASLEKYYPKTYYSFGSIQDKRPSWNLAIRRKFLYPPMTKHKLGWGGYFGRLFCRLGDGPPFHPSLRFLARPVPFDAAVLDVGCGSGGKLLDLRNCGFTNLHGVDPFISKPLSYSGGVRISKCQLNELKGKFSLITFHHVFEHLENPLEVLRQARHLLAEGGQILIRIPVSDSAAAQKYKAKWVQLDAPRHITLQTRKSMELLAEKAEMKIFRVVYDSSEFQFWGSEQYLMDIPLMDPRSFWNNSRQTIFNDETIRSFAVEAEKLNREQQGDQAIFIFVP